MLLWSILRISLSLSQVLSPPLPRLHLNFIGHLDKYFFFNQTTIETILNQVRNIVSCLPGLCQWQTLYWKIYRLLLYCGPKLLQLRQYEDNNKTLWIHLCLYGFFCKSSWDILLCVLIARNYTTHVKNTCCVVRSWEGKMIWADNWGI